MHLTGPKSDMQSTATNWCMADCYGSKLVDLRPKSAQGPYKKQKQMREPLRHMRGDRENLYPLEENVPKAH